MNLGVEPAALEEIAHLFRGGAGITVDARAADPDRAVRRGGDSILAWAVSGVIRDAVEGAVGAEGADQHLAVAQAVLQSQRDGVLVEQVACALDGVLSVEAFDEEQGEIDRLVPVRGLGGGGGDLHCALAGGIDHLDAFVIEGVDRALIDVEEHDVLARVHHLCAEQLSHGAGADYRYLHDYPSG